MFFIKSDVITLESIEVYGFVTVWMSMLSMYDGPYWVILLTYGSYDMRHIGFRGLTVVNETPGIGASHIRVEQNLEEKRRQKKGRKKRKQGR